MLSTRYRKVIIIVSVAVIFSFKGKLTNFFFKTIYKRGERFVGEILTCLECFLLEPETFF